MKTKHQKIFRTFFTLMLVLTSHVLWGMDGAYNSDNDTELEMQPLVNGIKKPKYCAFVIDPIKKTTKTYFDYLPPEIVEKILIYVLNSKEFELATQEQDDDSETSLVSALENLNLEEGLTRPRIKPLHINIKKLGELTNAQKRSCSQNLLTALEGNHELYLKPSQAYSVLVYILNHCNQEFAALPDKSSLTVEELLEKFKQTFAHTSLIERAVVLSQEEYDPNDNGCAHFYTSFCCKKDTVCMRGILGCLTIVFCIGCIGFCIWILSFDQTPVGLGIVIPCLICFNGFLHYCFYQLYLPDCATKLRRI